MIQNLFHSTNNGTTWLAPQEREGLNVSTMDRNDVGLDNSDEDGEGEDNFLYEWIDVPLLSFQKNGVDIDADTSIDADIDVNLGNVNQSSLHTLSIRSMKSSLSLMESHVGEEIWDAAKLFCTHLSLMMSNEKNGNFQFPTTTATTSSTSTSNECPSLLYIPIRGKRVLELGSGCGTLGMCCSVMGASEVLCTDYLPEVMDNLAFNLKHNSSNNDNNNVVYNENNNRQTNSWIKCGVLDWRDFVAEDLKEAEWMMDGEVFIGDAERQQTTRIVDKNEENAVYFGKKASTFAADIIVGSALVYSPQGAVCCADTIQYFFETHNVKEVTTLSSLHIKMYTIHTCTY